MIFGVATTCQRHMPRAGLRSGGKKTDMGTLDGGDAVGEMAAGRKVDIEVEVEVTASMLGGKTGLNIDGSLRLFRREEVPIWLRFNPYILSGYRSGLTVQQCLSSVFAIHNETGTTICYDLQTGKLGGIPLLSTWPTHVTPVLAPLNENNVAS